MLIITNHQNSMGGSAMTAEHTVKDPVCGMSVNPPRRNIAAAWRENCISVLRCKSSLTATRDTPQWRTETGQTRGSGHHVHLPDASGNSPAGRRLPICGMAPEPEQGSLDGGPSAELKACRDFGLAWCWPCRYWCWKWADISPALTDRCPNVNWIQLVLATQSGLVWLAFLCQG